MINQHIFSQHKISSNQKEEEKYMRGICRLFGIGQRRLQNRIKTLLVLRCFPQHEDGERPTSLKLIIFRSRHFFSFIHLARLCIVYYFCRFSLVQVGKKPSRSRARLKKKKLPIRNLFWQKIA